MQRSRGFQKIPLYIKDRIHPCKYGNCPTRSVARAAQPRARAHRNNITAILSPQQFLLVVSNTRYLKVNLQEAIQPKICSYRVSYKVGGSGSGCVICSMKALTSSCIENARAATDTPIETSRNAFTENLALLLGRLGGEMVSSGCAATGRAAAEGGGSGPANSGGSDAGDLVGLFGAG